jgi:CRISPR system Cascade subunit CasE
MAFDGKAPDLQQFVAGRFAPPPPPPNKPHKEQPPRKEGTGFLFRIEGPICTHNGLRPRILVQSFVKPDWDAAFRNAPFLIVQEEGISVKVYDPSKYTEGQVLRFRLRANPTKREKATGKRLGLRTPEEQRAWLSRMAVKSGFDLICDALSVREDGFQHSRRSKMIDPQAHVHRAVVLEGLLRVTSKKDFREAIASGIGSAKAYGFGLLSVAPA